MFLKNVFIDFSRCIIQVKSISKIFQTGNPYLRGRTSTIDLLVPTSLEQLLFALKILFASFTRHAILMRRSVVQSLPVQLVFPDISMNLVIAIAMWRIWLTFNGAMTFNRRHSAERHSAERHSAEQHSAERHSAERFTSTYKTSRISNLKMFVIS
jgi:ABC-type nickel/cobalt efflux system permease component RcnA